MRTNFVETLGQDDIFIENPKMKVTSADIDVLGSEVLLRMTLSKNRMELRLATMIHLLSSVPKVFHLNITLLP